MYVPTEGKTQFYAFISHKSSDTNFALKLQKFIESYNLPASICRVSGLEKRRLTPLCSYEVDFSSSPLLDEMQDKLERSKYLILLCSEELMKGDPKYINYEIRTFIECKRAEGIDPLRRIIPIIVSGEFGSQEHECCPQALSELGDNCPIALDRKKYKNDRELFLHVISSLLGIDYAVIENRDKKRQRRKKLIWGTALTLLVAIGAALGEYFIPREYRYVDFAMKNGLPEGIGALSKEECRRMKGHYVITWQKHKIQSLEYVNAYGNRIDHSGKVYDGDRPAAYLYSYTDEGLSTVTYENRFGVPYFILQYSGNSVSSADLRNPYDTGEAFYIGSGYERSPAMLLADVNEDAHSDISRFRYEYSPEGYVTKLVFCSDSTGRLAQDNSVYGFEYVPDEKGRVSEVYFLDAQGERRLNSEGLYCRKFSYDERDDLVEWTNYGRNGQALADAEGIVRCVFYYDENHNLSQYFFLDEEGKAMYAESYGGAAQEQYVDERGNVVLVRLIAEDGTPNEASGYCAMAYSHDENGYTAGRCYLDREGQLVLDPDLNYAEIRYVNDGKGNPVQRSYHDERGNLIDNAYGYASELVEYDEQGRETSHAYFDAQGEPADYRGYGYSRVEIAYDERGRETSKSYFGPEGEPVNTAGPIFSFGYHREETVYEYGAHTKLTINYYGADGNAVNMCSSLGEEYAKSVLYVQNGEITSIANYREDGSVFGDIMESETTRSAQAEPITRYLYTDGNGNTRMEVVKQYRINGVEKETTTTEFDGQGNTLSVQERLYYDNGQCRSDTIREYDPDGNVTNEYIREFDEQGNVIRQTLTDPTYPDAPTYIVLLSYDDTGVLTEEQHLNLRYDGSTASSSIRSFNSDGSKDSVDTAYFDEDGKIFNRTVTEYAGGMKVSAMEYDYDGEEILFASTETRYREDGSVAVRAFRDYDESGLLFASTEFLNNLDGTTTQTTVFYDEQGNAEDTLLRLLDENGNEIE